MVRDHAAVNDQALALVKKLGVAPEANGTSAALSEEAKQQMRKLNGLDGAAFDKAYVQNEIAYHRTVNDALSGTLIPGAHNPDLKSLLEPGLTLFRRSEERRLGKEGNSRCRHRCRTDIEKKKKKEQQNIG